MRFHNRPPPAEEREVRSEERENSLTILRLLLSFPCQNPHEVYPPGRELRIRTAFAMRAEPTENVP